MRTPSSPAHSALHCAVAALLCALCACAPAGHRLPAQASAVVEGDDLDEISGIAASRLHPGVVWTLEDGGNPAELTALDAAGRRRAVLRIAGADNVDWEDLARFDWRGRSHLLIADVGDNDAQRPRVRLLAVAEPERLRDATHAPVWERELVWSDGPRDCEAVVVDAARSEILLVTKRTFPPRLYVAPLPPDPPSRSDAMGRAHGPSAPLRAEFAATLAGVPVVPEAEVRADPSAAWRHQPTAASLSPDGRRLAVMTYAEVLIYTRRGDEDWAAAVARAPRSLALPSMPQAEAISWTADGRALLATGEKTPVAIYRLRAPAR